MRSCLGVLALSAFVALAPPRSHAAPPAARGSLEIKGTRGKRVRHDVIGNEPVNDLRDDIRRLTLKGGASVVFRPESLWRQGQFERQWLSPFGRRADAERAIYATSVRLGLGVVPRTRHAVLDRQYGSIQHAVKGSDFTAADGSALHTWDWDSVHGVLVLQFVTGLADGHHGNVLVDRSGPTRRFRIVDGETTFAGKQPYAPRSVLLPFLAKGPPQLSPRLWGRLRRADVDMWRVDLLTLGVPRDRIDAAVHRLELVRTHGLEAVRRGLE